MRTLSAAVIGLGFAGMATAQTTLLDEIVISPDRTPTDAARTGSTVSVITEGELERRSRPFALDLLREVPALAVSQNGPPGTVSGFTLRGLPQEYVRVIVDGIEVSDPTGPQVAPSLTNLLTGDLSRIEVLKGSQSAVYGGQAVAGVIDITTARPTRDGVENRFAFEGGSFDSYRGGYTFAARTERADVAFSLQHLRTDGFSAAEEAAGNAEDDGYETTRASASTTIHLSDTARLIASAFYQTEDGDFDASFPIEDAPNTFEADSWGALVGAEFITGPVENRLAYSRYEIDRSSDEPLSPFTFDAEGSRDRVEYLGRLEVDPSLAFQVGADYSGERARTVSDFAGFVTDAGRQSSWIAGLYGQAIWAPTDPLTIGLTLRYDHHSEFDGYLTGRASAAYALPTDTILRASAGSGFRPPSLNELFGPFGSNPDLEPEQSRSFDAGLEQRFADGRGRATATLFWLEVDDRIEYTDRYVQIGGTDRSRGLELAGLWDLTDRLTLTGAYTYTDAELDDGSRRNRVPRHDLVLGLDATPLERLSIGAQVQYVADVVDRTGTLPPGAPELIGDYTLVSGRAAYAVTETVEVYLRAENLFDEQYQTVRGYGTADRAFYVGLAARF